MTARAGLLLMVAVLMGATEARAQSSCPPAGAEMPERSVDLQTSVAETTFFNDKSIDQITAALGYRRVPGGIFFNGLTRVHTEFSVRPRTITWRLPDGKACAVVGQVRARWDITEMKVDVAREYPPGSCQNTVVTHHEGGHVIINTRIFQSYVPRLEARLNEVVKAIPVVRADTEAAAKEQVFWYLMEGTRQVREEFENERSRFNNNIDTPDAYKAMRRLCPRW